MRSRSLLPRAGVVAATLLAVALVSPVSAKAAPWPSAPTGIRLASVSGSSFTVELSRGANVQSYVLWASTTESDLYYTHLMAHSHPTSLHYGASSSPMVTVGNLGYTTATYYYRLESRNGGNRSVSASIYSVGLRPATPTRPVLHSSALGTYLTWTSGAVTGFAVQEAADPAMTSSPHTFWIRGNTHQFTPWGLSREGRYFFRIAAVNHNSVSSYSPVISGSTLTREQGVHVMTYNILGLGEDGTVETGGTIAPWSQRRLAAAALIKSVNPGVIGVQEGAQWVGSRPGIRQVDSLCSALNALGKRYVVARTEVPYPERGWTRYGNYILYDSAVYQAVGAAGHWSIGSGNVAAYQQLRRRATGATFLFVTAHLTQTPGRSWDLVRQDETATMVRLARAQGSPVVYGGDFNSNPEQPAIDGPGLAMQAAGVVDARLRAQYRVNERYDSFNNYARTPYPYSLFLDHIWVSPGVSASSWGVAMRLSNGRMVGTIPSDHNPVHAYIRFPY